MSEIHDECGVAAIYHLPGTEVSPLCGDCLPGEVSRLLPRMLLDIQNRGQLAAGMTSLQPDRRQLIDTHKEIGTVSEVFRLSHTRQAREPDAGVCGPSGDRARALRHLRQGRSQLRPAV